LAEEQQAVGFVEPEVEELKVSARLNGNMEEIAKRLSTLELFYLKQTPDGVVLLRVESKDIHNRPFLFFLVTLGPSAVTVQYSIAHDSSVKLRRLYVVKNLLSILSLITDVYNVDNASLLQHADSAIDDVINSMPQNYSTLYNTYDSLYNEYRELRRLNIELSASNKNLTVQGVKLSNENRELMQKLKELQSYSDEALMARVQDWIESHDSTIDIDEFSKTNNITPPRVEQVLNTMISLGYIAIKG